MIDQPTMQRLRAMAGAGVEALQDYLGQRIAAAHHTLESAPTHEAIRFTQGQIAECRALLTVVAELKKGSI